MFGPPTDTFTPFSRAEHVPGRAPELGPGLRAAGDPRARDDPQERGEGALFCGNWVAVPFRMFGVHFRKLLARFKGSH